MGGHFFKNERIKIVLQLIMFHVKANIKFKKIKLLNNINKSLKMQEEQKCAPEKIYLIE